MLITNLAQLKEEIEVWLINNYYYKPIIEASIDGIISALANYDPSNDGGFYDYLEFHTHLLEEDIDAFYNEVLSRCEVLQ